MHSDTHRQREKIKGIFKNCFIDVAVFGYFVDSASFHPSLPLFFKPFHPLRLDKREKVMEKERDP